MGTLDQTDLKLLDLLQKDSTYSMKELAKEVSLSLTPVYERVKRLEKDGFIKKYVAILDAAKLGLGLTVFCQVKIKSHTKEIGNQFIKDVMSVNEVVDCYNISGDYDFLLKVIVRDMKHYQNFVLNVLGEVKNIGSAHSTFVMGEIKSSHAICIS